MSSHYHGGGYLTTAGTVSYSTGTGTWQRLGTTAENPPEQDKLDPDRAPDLVGEVLGWRQWHVSPAGDLISANSHAVWRAGPQRAICGGIDGEWDHPAPQENCGCGWYGIFEPPGGGAVGLFRAWGKIIVHPNGFRAEWAEIVCLVGERTKKLERAAAYYEIPLFESRDEAVAYARKGGHDFIPEDMRPKSEPPTELAFPGWQIASPGMAITWTSSGTGVELESPHSKPPLRQVVLWTSSALSNGLAVGVGLALGSFLWPLNLALLGGSAFMVGRWLDKRKAAA